MHPPRSKLFDDVYFSAENGLEETRHVFLKGNHLPEAWQGHEDFTIAETGFGTGLNFLAVAELFKAKAAPGQKLHYISVEKYPLAAQDIQNALTPWRGDLSLIDRLCEVYPLLMPGFHKITLSPAIDLLLIFDDVNVALPEISATVNAWFLDGFKPASNPEMWTQTVFENMARLSAKSTTLATFTAAGAVRRGLQDAGFEISKVKGYGRKREMLIGVKP